MEIMRKKKLLARIVLPYERVHTVINPAHVHQSLQHGRLGAPDEIQESKTQGGRDKRDAPCQFLTQNPLHK